MRIAQYRSVRRIMGEAYVQKWTICGQYVGDDSDDDYTSLWRQIYRDPPGSVKVLSSFNIAREFLSSLDHCI